MMMSNSRSYKKNILIIVLLIITLLFVACERKSSVGNNQENSTGKEGGLTSIEAMELVYGDASKVFEDAVLLRMAPVSEKDSVKMQLDPDWQRNDRAYHWFIWYADANGENWLLYSTTGKKIENRDIGTRSFSVMTMGKDWPRKSTKVSMKEAATAIKEAGAAIDYVEWIEFSCVYPLRDFINSPVWSFTIAQPVEGGITYRFRIFVDALTGKVKGAVNDRNEPIPLPINLEELAKEREETHEEDLKVFLSHLEKGEIIDAVSQLSYTLSPDEAAAERWSSNFRSLRSVKMLKVEQTSLEQWTDNYEIYKVVFQIKTDETPDKYGWDNGENIRWISIIPQGAGLWKIESMNTSP